MIATERGAMRAATLVVVAWLVGALALLWNVGARTEEALAVAEARSVAASFGPDLRPARTARRFAPAAGPVRQAVRAMERELGAATAARLGDEERAATWRGPWYRYVSVPVKDAEAWDVVGVVVLRLGMPSVPPWAWVAVLVAFLVGAPLVRRGMRKVVTDTETAPYYLVADVLAVLALGTVVVALLMRGHLDEVAARLPALTLQTRFDPLARYAPGGRLVALALTGWWAVASVVLVAVAWLASPRRPAADRRATRTAWVFLAPSALHVLVFTLGPLVFTAWLSVHRWDLLDVERPFVGLANYRELAADPLFWNALRNTALYALYVPVTMVLALGAAVLLNQPLRGVRVLRAMVFLPAVVSYVAIAMVWQWIYHADYGVLNHVIRLLGGTGTDWLGNPGTALVALMIVSAWVQLGYQMVVYLAGLQGVPPTLLEAARLEGATPWQRFWLVTFPLLRPVSLYLLVTGIIWSFQVFALVYVMTEGGPARSTDVLVYQIYQNAWEFRRMGYASAMSWVLFALLIGLTLLQWRWLNRRIEHAA